MLSRVADSLYWMSRYLERAENTVRQLDVTMSLMLDTGGANAEARWQRMVASLGKPADMEWNGVLESMARKLVFDSLIPPPSPIASMARAKTRARCAKKSPPSSGSASTASITRCTRRMRKRNSAPASTTSCPPSSMASISSRASATPP